MGINAAGGKSGAVETLIRALIIITGLVNLHLGKKIKAAEA